MSFLAYRKSTGEEVVPEEVDDGVDVECPMCEETLRARGPSIDGRARHFFHLTDSDCPGGESDTHRKQKSLAASALRSNVNAYEQCELEVEIDVCETRTAVDTRRADVLLEFAELHQVFGQGIIVEVQYGNRTKNIPATTFDYLSNGYSVIWADQDAFTERRFLLSELIVQFDESESTYRPTLTDPDNLLPLEPPPLIGTKHYFDERESGPESPTMRSADTCEHQWVEQQEFCYTCGDCGAKLHANPTVWRQTEGESEGEDADEKLDGEKRYVLSLNSDTSFATLSTFRSRGKLIEIRSEARDCPDCRYFPSGVISGIESPN